MTTSTEYIGRQNDLTSRLNKHLQKLTGLNNDFASSITETDLLDFKAVLSDINNLLTLKMTDAAVIWLCNYFEFDNVCKMAIFAKTNSAKPNSNGYDIHITESEKIIAEVKCIRPVNNGDKFGAAQYDSILNDIIKLKKGKGKVDTSSYYKFLFLIDLGEQTDKALFDFLKLSKTSKNKPLRAERQEVKKNALLLFDSVKKRDLSVDKIYIKTIKLN
ncbi:MAG TPA: hypothetical protein VKG26_16635 [Bacteroidia bacterium]|nr:hypothetical protein [Bacteroidia bacterium]